MKEGKFEQLSSDNPFFFQFIGIHSTLLDDVFQFNHSSKIIPNFHAFPNDFGSQIPPKGFQQIRFSEFQKLKESSHSQHPQSKDMHHSTFTTPINTSVRINPQ
jgi:hypothetical protein